MSVAAMLEMPVASVSVPRRWPLVSWLETAEIFAVPRFVTPVES
jgi:hypothetical protein